MNQSVAIILAGMLLLSIIALIINIYNKLVMLKFNAEKAFSNIDVILKQRADEIPNIVSVAKHFMNYEKEILNSLTELRTSFMNAENTNSKTEISNEISQKLKSFFAVAENYPELKSNSNFLEIQKRVSALEDKISDRREFFNDSVSMYNIGIHEFPNVLIAPVLGYQDKSMLMVTDAEKDYKGVGL